ncbi:MalY/PatB family protein [Schleiferilactobacillus harbinensis]|uniref:MalY/PatB family protein n=1 Tax=Schleiferilactobacillus harbinensis TaxID=304207 RepID=UPI0007B7B115|nr:MalY/PatB family protein [Schleiferilactobacillus harbinensis]
MYDFVTVPPRRHTNSIKWNVQDTELPMWIADMEFETAPEIKAALQTKVAAGIFGYEKVPAELFTTVAAWNQRQHHFSCPPEWMLFATGVMPAIAAIIRRLTNPGDNIVLQPPVYNMFFNAVESNGRHILANNLIYDAHDLSYAIDFADLEKKLADLQTTMMLLCNPHNPIGKLWSRDELIRIVTLCRDNSVTLISDEIHRDWVLADHDYVSIDSLPADLIQHIIATVSPSKTFNLAGLHAAIVTIPNPALQAIVAHGLAVDWLGEPNLVAIPGTIAAYSEGDAWLAALKAHLRNNVVFAQDYLAQRLPQIKFAVPEASYLLWLDCTAVTSNSARLNDFLREKTGLVLAAGTDYGAAGRHFLRMNIACPQTMLADGLARLATGIQEYQE